MRGEAVALVAGVGKTGLQGPVVNLSNIEKSLLLATYFRGNPPQQEHWTSSSDQVVTLSLFYTDDISFDECEIRFSRKAYVGNLYVDGGELDPLVASRYGHLIELLRKHPDLIKGSGGFERPADPTFTACKLTAEGDQLALSFVDLFPTKPEFLNWPDRRSLPT